MHIQSKRLLNPLLKGWIGILIVSILTAGCEWGDKNVTLVRPDTDNLQVVFTDTVTVLRSTVMKDSLYTGAGYMLSGMLKDQTLGTIEASSNIQFATSGGISIEERAVYDSIAFASKYVYYYGDTTKRYQITAHELLTDITRGPYFNNGVVSYSPTSLGQASFTPRPKSNDSLRIRLPDSFGMKLFDEAKANKIKTQDDLLKLFKGITLVAKESNGVGVLGYVPERTNIVLHYHVDGPDGKVKYSAMLTVKQFFNKIANDRTGTPFAALKDLRQRLSTDLTDGVSITQSGVGLMTRIDFPFLQQFGQEFGKVLINRAFLRIQLPRIQEYKGQAPPPRIALYRTGPNSDWTGSTEAVTAMGDLVLVDTENLRYYEIDLTQEVMALAKMQQHSNVGYLIGPISGSGTESYSNTLDRLILPKGSVKLHIYYSTLYSE